MNISEALKEASSFLAEAGIWEAESNARLLLGNLLGQSPAAFLAAQREPFPAEHKAAWEAAVTRKAAGEPAQYIIGEQEFYGLPFKVSPTVLIPRPETELLVERIAELGQRLWPGGSPAAADIGTGSGAIAAALKSLRPAWQVTATDISPAALEVARDNARRLELDIAFKQGNLLEPLAGEAPDLIVSNPPYIPARDIEGLQTEVRDYEPRSALDGGADGLDPYRVMMEQLPLLKAPPRLIGFELGMGQAGDVAELLRRAGHWTEIEIIKDYAGIERHVIGIDL
ncbi:peptide chain release factor N(5)-glutamine methyltransferase [Paenibacillus sp. CAA11]|uniref:peptide chain release factor N(5)-glutamine methyltransferase n=1 Tax=Paenibacillus sp. CAA11 TaxID=1532905 RepID=UPI000D37F40F|nr:peptide chain release factor N(5)-glutamine methyltransferase [Paenibacillus sp. CAA11]AWB47073.1 peptide chain release factor N(5)-glutamine methyltransferase [Paenibacillus sp. CAA11]